MLTHISVLTWKREVTDAQIQAMCDGLASLPGLIPEIRGYRFGRDAGLVEGNAAFAVVAELDDVAAYRIYAAHPAHRDVIDRLVAPLVERRTAVQLES